MILMQMKEMISKEAKTLVAQYTRLVWQIKVLTLNSMHKSNKYTHSNSGKKKINSPLLQEVTISTQQCKIKIFSSLMQQESSRNKTSLIQQMKDP